MRLLTLSLIVMVLAATIGLGWVLDRLFVVFVPPSSTLSSDSILVLENIGQGLAQTIDKLEQPTTFVENWPHQGRYSIHYIQQSDIQLPSALLQQISSGEPLLLTNDNDISIYYYLPSHQAMLLLKPTFSALESSKVDAKLFLTLLFYGALILLIWLWTYPLVSRLLNLRITAQLFGKGQLDQRIKVGSVSYVKDLELEFNNMAQRIEHLVGDVKLISSAVSHDLRTPLARMRFGIDTIADDDDPAQKGRYLKRLSHDVDEMTKLVEILLDYARLDQSMLKIDNVPVDIISLVKKCIANIQSVEKHVMLHSSIEQFELIGDPKYLTILVNNLLQNALQYARSQVEVRLNVEKGGVQLTIGDDGPGFAGNSQDMLKPYVRGKASHVKGYGMGLAIVARILEWHKGQVVLSRCERLNGAKITVTLPKNHR